MVLFGFSFEKFKSSVCKFSQVSAVQCHRQKLFDTNQYLISMIFSDYVV